MKQPPLLVLLPLLLVTLNFCSQKLAMQKVNAIEVRDSNSLHGPSFYRIFYQGPFIMYQSQYQLDSTLRVLKSDASGKNVTMKDSLSVTVMKLRYFVFHRDSTYGYRYDPGSNENNTRLSVDSVVKQITGTNTFEKILTLKADSTIWNADKTELKEVYSFPAEKERGASRWNFYFSKQLNHLPATFSKTLDSAKGMKLYKTEYLSEEFTFGKEKNIWPAMRISSEMKTITVDKPEEINSYFSKYQEKTK